MNQRALAILNTRFKYLFLLSSETKGTDFSPIIVDNEKEGNIAWCGCKATGNSPYCDGTHSKL